MKTNRISNVLPLAFALAALSVSPILAADSGNDAAPSGTPPSGEGHHHHHGGPGFLSSDEKAKLKSAHEKALKSNPELKSERESLHADRKALFEKMKSHHEKMKAAMLKADPTLKPLFDKMDAHRKEWMSKFKKDHPDFKKHDSE